MEQLRIMQATILHMVQSAQIGCTTPASEYNLFIYLLLHLLPIFFFFAFLITLWTFWHALHARESFFTACRPPTSPVSDGFDDANYSRAKKVIVERENENAERPKSAYPTTSLPFASLVFLICLLVFLFRHLLAVMAIWKQNEGIYLEVES
jgi:hypothetical protein